MSKQFYFRYERGDGTFQNEEEDLPNNEGPGDEPMEAELERLTNFDEFTSVAAETEMIVDGSDEQVAAQDKKSEDEERTTEAPSKGNRYSYQLKRMVVNYKLENCYTAAECHD
ncbi:hypothetical protein BCR43DRAFT_518414 [Syncephalastrum racemosum]|uniref:Uncharacterized protein n=1 Tax=Syncephalastrum racemosum TaxID=13706 RepID=A0A1X2H0S6_SYNRA|nr:hypothetical protein BCR43DRAFT_518414 [Syncephalastrum racemosum]